MQTNPQHTKQGAKNTNPIVDARDLVPRLIARTKQRLFGAYAAFGQMSFRGSAVISDGDIGAFMAERVARYGVENITAPSGTMTLDEAIIDIATQVAVKVGYRGNLETAKVQRIAAEYVVASCFLKPGEVEPFSRYLARSIELRAAIKDLNAGAKASADETFEQKSPREVEGMNATTVSAWGTITSLLAMSKHLRTLRTTIVTPFLYATIEAWAQLKGLDASVRQATLAKLRTAVMLRGNPFITETDVAEAIARVQGNLLLSDGSEYGVRASTVVEAIGAGVLSRAERNGGTKVTLTGANPSDIGASIAGFNAGIDGTVERKDDRTVTLALTVREGLPGIAPFAVPVPAPQVGAQQYAS